MKIKKIIFLALLLLIVLACKEKKSEQIIANELASEIISKQVIDSIIANPPKDMVWIPGGTFLQGAVPQDQINGNET